MESAKPGQSCRTETWALIGLAIGFVVLASVYNVTTPILKAPDEGSHVWYVRHLKESVILFR